MKMALLLSMVSVAQAADLAGFVSPGDLAREHAELSGLVGCTRCHTLGVGLDDRWDSSIFKATLGGSIGSLNFGNLAQGDLSEESLLSDLTAAGSLGDRSDWGRVDLVYVPEPSAALLLIMGAAIGLLRTARVRTVCLIKPSRMRHPK